jgi:post-segregation antitoxin (ccd killing protein)
MQVTVTIPDELAAEVQARGLALDTYVRELVEEKLTRERTDESRRRNAVEAMLQFGQKHGAKLGGLDLKGMVHEGHKF